MRKKFTKVRSVSADNLTVVLMLNGEPMLYLGPLETRQRLQQVASSRPKIATTAISAYAKEPRGSTITLEQEADEYLMDLPPYGIERRTNEDRRASQDDPFLETRANKDRRKKRRPSINISI